MNGTQPIPLSTDTNFRSGNRVSTFEVIRSQHWTPFFMNKLTAAKAW